MPDIFFEKKIIYFLLSRVLVRAVSYTIHGLIPASCVFADRYNREEVVASLGREINLNPPLTLGQLPDTSEELLKLDQVRSGIAEGWAGRRFFFSFGWCAPKILWAREIHHGLR